MGWGGAGAGMDISSIGGGGADVGMSGADASTQAVGEAGSGAMPSSFGKDALEAYGKQKGGSGATVAAKRPIGEHPEATHLGPAEPRAGFARLAEVPGRQRRYGQP